MINFFKFNSRLGLFNPPNGYADKNIGVEEAPGVILDDSYLSLLQSKSVSSKISEFTFSLPESVTSDKYLKTMYLESREAIKLTKDILQSRHTSNNGEKRRSIFLGGDHSIGMIGTATILDLISPENIEMVMIDSHADIHQPSTSPSGNFHGMWVRPVLDKFEDMDIDSLFPDKLPAKQFTYIGHQDIEKEEREFIEKNNIRVIDHLTFNLNPRKVARGIKERLNTKKHLHMTFDLDAIDKKFAPGTGMPCEDGVKDEPLYEFFSELSNLPSISIGIVEFNPRKDKDNKTLNLIRKVIELLVID